MGMPNSYTALRTPNITYVEYENGDREFYDRRTDPAELNNTYGLLGGENQARLAAALERYRGCRRAASCWSAGQARGIPAGLLAPPPRSRIGSRASRQRRSRCTCRHAGRRGAFR